MTTTGRPANDRPAFLPIKRWFESGTSTGRLPKVKSDAPRRRSQQEELLDRQHQRLLFSREDWSLYTSLATLPQRAGVTASALPWLVIKEFCDNALDSADAAGRPGAVEISVDPRGNLTVADEGTGIPNATPERIAQFVLRRPTDAQQQAFAPSVERLRRQWVEGCRRLPHRDRRPPDHRDRRHPGGTGARDRRHQPHRQQQDDSADRGPSLGRDHRRCAVH